MPSHSSTLALDLTLEQYERFWSKVNKSGECWIWTRAKTAAGYGVISHRGKLIYAHRLAWELTHGPIPAGMKVCHNCPSGDNPSCCNPAHVFIGTQRDNMADASAKGRMATGERSGPVRHPESMSFRANRARGERTGTAILNDVAVREIRRAYAAGEKNQYELAACFGVTQSAIQSVVRGKTWRHLL